MATSPGKFLTIAGVAIFTCVSFAQDLNPFIGTWDIDLAASSFGSATAPKNMSRVYEDAGNGSYMFLVVSIAEDGSIGGGSATYKFDNKENPLASLSLTAPTTISYIQNNEKTVQYY